MREFPAANQFWNDRMATTSAAQWPTDSNVGKWDNWYSELTAKAGVTYGDPVTYFIAAAFLADCELVEDRGCGGGGFRRVCMSKYVGIDGSKTPFADKIADLCTYRSSVPGIVMRHILELNYQWEQVLRSALDSFQKKFCLILFTPFAEQTREIAHNRASGVDVPDLSFSRADIEKHLVGLNWKLMQDLGTKSQYGVEHIYFIWRS